MEKQRRLPLTFNGKTPGAIIYDEVQRVYGCGIHGLERAEMDMQTETMEVYYVETAERTRLVANYYRQKGTVVFQPRR